MGRKNKFCISVKVGEEIRVKWDELSQINSVCALCAESEERTYHKLSVRIFESEYPVQSRGMIVMHMIMHMYDRLSTAQKVASLEVGKNSRPVTVSFSRCPFSVDHHESCEKCGDNRLSVTATLDKNDVNRYWITVD